MPIAINDLRQRCIEINGQMSPTSSPVSYPMVMTVANQRMNWIMSKASPMKTISYKAAQSLIMTIIFILRLKYCYSSLEISLSSINKTNYSSITDTRAEI
jgi:hypothetical protein